MGDKCLIYNTSIKIITHNVTWQGVRFIFTTMNKLNTKTLCDSFLNIKLLLHICNRLRSYNGVQNWFAFKRPCSSIELRFAWPCFSCQHNLGHNDVVCQSPKTCLSFDFQLCNRWNELMGPYWCFWVGQYNRTKATYARKSLQIMDTKCGRDFGQGSHWKIPNLQLRTAPQTMLGVLHYHVRSPQIVSGWSTYPWFVLLGCYMLMYFRANAF